MASKLYPKGWPTNLRAVLYLNKKRRSKFLQSNTAEAAWSLGVWYQIGDTVTYSAIVYRCVQNHESVTGREPDTDTDRWEAV